ncbi:MAG: helix-turn-helix domain-containing protein [Defluviitaleaceae bacterium]|nr:helix-turn-helix domain-containing protein [Defluviitaleaceae bacterium]
MFNIGSFIKTKRMERRISQEELCYGICSVSTLSRIELGKQNPSTFVLESLILRLGLNEEKWGFFSTQDKIKSYNLRYDISLLLEKNEFGKAEEYLKEFKKIKNLENPCYTFIKFVELVLMSEKGLKVDEVITEMLEIVNCFIKNYSPKKIYTYFLSKDEINILNFLAIYYGKNKQKEKALEIYYGLKEGIERNFFDKSSISSLYTTILYNLSKELLQVENFYECIEIAEIGINNFKKYHFGFRLPGLLFNKACALIELNKLKEGTELLIDTYHLLKVYDLDSTLKKIEDYCKNKNLKIRLNSHRIVI